MTFLAPWLLAALPAVGIPVIIHLLNRGRPRKIRWAAMQFLLDSVRKNQRRLQLRDLILLLLRALIVALLILLFARPAFWTVAGSSGLVPSPVSAMMVIDISASMAQSDGRNSRLDLARRVAQQTLEKFSSDSLCGLILATDRAIPIVPRPSNNLELVRDSLDSIRGSFGATDLYPALERSFQELARSQGARRIVFVITDSQESAWRERAAIRDLSTKYPGIELRSIPVGGAGGSNTAITGITIHPSMLRVGEPATVAVEVANLTENPLDGLRVTLAANRDRPQDEATLPTVPVGKSASVNLKITFDKTGFQTLRAEIPQDHFPLDNLRSLAVRVGNPSKFLIVATERGSDPRTTPAFFLRTALAATQKGAEVQVVPPDQLTSAEIDSARAIFVCSPGGLDDDQWRALEKNVKGGGGVVVFPETDSGSLGDTLSTQWLPASLGKKLPLPAFWSQAGMGHPVTAVWADANRTRLTNINADIRYELAPHKDAVPLAKYSDGVPVAVSIAVGAGSVVLFGSAPVPDSTNLVLHPFFPILIGGLVNFLTVNPGTAPSLRPSESFSATVPVDMADKKIFLESDRDTIRTEVGAVSATEAQGIMKIPVVESPGGYRVFLEGEKEAVAAFSVALDPSESVLTTSAPLQWEAIASKASSRAEAIQSGHIPREAWMLFAVVLLMASLAELTLAHRFTVTR